MKIRFPIVALAILIMANIGVAETTKEFSSEITKLKTLAVQGNSDAQLQLGVIYVYGAGGVEVNKVEGVKWYRMAADQGIPFAQSLMGDVYTEGRGVTKDDKEGARWYQLAADQGEAIAQVNLGHMYEMGEGVPQDLNKAAKLYRAAAEQGQAVGQSQLGLLYISGKGVKQSLHDAYAWFLTSESAGDARSTKFIKDIYEKLSPFQREYGRRMAAKYSQSYNNRKNSPPPKVTNRIEERVQAVSVKPTITSKTALDVKDPLSCLSYNLKGGLSPEQVIELCGEPLNRQRGTFEGIGQYGELAHFKGEIWDYSNATIRFMDGKVVTLGRLHERDPRFTNFYPEGSPTPIITE